MADIRIHNMIRLQLLWVVLSTINLITQRGSFFKKNVAVVRYDVRLFYCVWSNERHQMTCSLRMFDSCVQCCGGIDTALAINSFHHRRISERGEFHILYKLLPFVGQHQHKRLRVAQTPYWGR